jgi:hypothetical protein
MERSVLFDVYGKIMYLLGRMDEANAQTERRLETYQREAVVWREGEKIVVPESMVNEVLGVNDGNK